ncbi:hypothetical protein RSAG8_03043, partial [Rhizoctonia solani AG-8 WAC10335]
MHYKYNTTTHRRYYTIYTTWLGSGYPLRNDHRHGLLSFIHNIDFGSSCARSTWRVHHRRRNLSQGRYLHHGDWIGIPRLRLGLERCLLRRHMHMTRRRVGNKLKRVVVLVT